jgi:hypothetical protein
MKIATFRSGGLKVKWLLLTPPTFKILHPDFTELPNHKGLEFSGIIGLLPEHCGPVTEAFVSNETDASIGFAACSVKDKFSLGVGMKKSLENALDGFEERPNTTQLWKDLMADGLLGPTLRMENEKPLATELFNRIQSLERTVFSSI